jgi:hypothetical protein
VAAGAQGAGGSDCAKTAEAAEAANRIVSVRKNVIVFIVFSLSNDVFQILTTGFLVSDLASDLAGRELVPTSLEVLS